MDNSKSQGLVTVALELESDKYIDSILESIQNTISLTDYEIAVLKSIITEMNKPLPSTVAGIQNRVTTLDACRVKLLNLLYSVSEKFIIAEAEYKKVYEPEYVRLTRAGRPSQVAIESEIHLNPIMVDKRILLNNYDSVKGLLYGYLKTIDNIKESCLRRWNDSF